MDALRIHIEHIWRHKWVVAAIAALAVLGALYTSFGAGMAYTGKSVLTIDSQARLPEQDVALARGYADTLNYLPYQERLRVAAGIPEDVTVDAGTAASGPMVIVEATSGDSAVAEASAAGMAEAFRDDFNANWRAGRDRAIADLEVERNEDLTALGSLPPEGPETALRTASANGIQDRISQLQADTTGQLQVLQSSAGVVGTAPSPARNLVLALFGGLVLGSVAALALAGLENRLTNRDEIREHLGVDTLVEIPPGGSASANRLREQRFKQLANVVGLADLSRPATIAVTAPRETEGTAQVAEAIAEYRAIQGERTLLVRADLRGSGTDGEPAGVGDFLRSTRSISVEEILQAGPRSHMRVMGPGVREIDSYSLFTRSGVAGLIALGRRAADLTVVETQPIVDAAESQVVCAAVDRIVLVIDKTTAHIADAKEACRLLAQADATLLGAIIIDPHAKPDMPKTPGLSFLVTIKAFITDKVSGVFSNFGKSRNESGSDHDNSVVEKQILRRPAVPPEPAPVDVVDGLHLTSEVLSDALTPSSNGHHRP
ncbi:hypothetical protein [Rhodococcus wratislaviensis]|uniref:Polysaccharide chain length determinant N-terminal domain-containing protein n=1 Tax=Rhodococcus wratislaviensis NBRC 100605 TaxID=1219028 RepID=X0RI03_RHOWR|nr:hypothetical protein [Rhodococcus wratislaviensis]GAF50720.1 hypothetical protein RW1_095_03450 [Rhodococcus wratislaviensis NBRC 100605]